MSRALWKGDISFGLVTVPVGLYTVERDTDIHFHRVTPDGSCRLRQKLYCPETEKEYDFGEATRGYEIAPGEYVILDKAELDALRPESGNTIDISSFIKLADIDPIYFQRTYLLAPEKRGQKPYQLLVKAMQEKEMAAIVKFTMRAN
ncbi:MAG: hypothetical protein KDD42_09570, partial [Bdellovibrionales bacterium]|nr:hypothetical protein [Bdellovibrionales bacterium]